MDESKFREGFFKKFAEKNKLWKRGGCISLGFAYHEQTNEDGKKVQVLGFRLPDGINSAPLYPLLPKIENAMRQIYDSYENVHHEEEQSEQSDSDYNVGEVFYYVIIQILEAVHLKIHVLLFFNSSKHYERLLNFSTKFIIVFL